MFIILQCLCAYMEAVNANAGEENKTQQMAPDVQSFIVQLKDRFETSSTALTEAISIKTCRK